MARKQPVEDRDVLRFKFQALQDYLAHHEQKLEQFQIDLRKLELLRSTGNVNDFSDRVRDALLDLYTAGPPKSLIEADLAAARAEVNAAYNSSPEWPKMEQGLIEAGIARDSIDAGFDTLLTYTITSMINQLAEMQHRATSALEVNQMADEVLMLMEQVRIVFNATLDPARHLRQRWINALNSRSPTTSEGSASPKRRGRPKSEDVARRDQKMQEAWLTGKYKTYVELGTEFKVSEDVARKAVRPSLRKRRADPDKSR